MIYFMLLSSTSSKVIFCSCTCSRSFLPQLACEPQTYFRSSLLSLRKITSANMSDKTISLTQNLLFWCSPVRSKVIECSASDWSRPRPLACLGFWRDLPNTIWNLNFTTITKFPATLNADFFVTQRLPKLCMWCGSLFSHYKIR